MVFTKQFSRKQLTVKQPEAGPRELASHSSTRIWSALLGIDGLFSNHISPCLSTRELLRLAVTCRELCLPARAMVTEVCVRRDIVRRTAVPRAIHKGLPLLPGLRVLDLSFIENLTAKDYTAMASALLGADAAPRMQLRAFRVRQRGGGNGNTIPQESDLCLLRFLQGVVTAQAWPLLEDLDISGHCVGDAAVELLCSWMEQTNRRRLKRLGVGSINMSEQGLAHLLGALAKGRCPILLRVDMSCNNCGGSGSGSSTGAGGGSSSISIATTEGGRGGKPYEALWTAALCAIPHLLELELRDSGVEGEVTLALATALAKGAGRKLKRLSLGGNSITDQDSLGLFHALAEGACMWLQDLNLKQTCLEREGFAALASVLEAQQLRYLRRLDVSENLLTYEGMQEIIGALKQGAAPQLRWLDLGSTGDEFDEVNEMARLWVTKLREDGKCPLVRYGQEEEKGKEGRRR